MHTRIEYLSGATLFDCGVSLFYVYELKFSFNFRRSFLNITYIMKLQNNHTKVISYEVKFYV